MYHFVENSGDAQIIKTDEWPQFIDGLLQSTNKQNWSSISPGFLTEAELISHCGILPDPCKSCGRLVKTSYYGNEELISANICFRCNLWLKRSREMTNKTVIVGNQYYTIGDELSVNERFRGFGGRKFVFESLKDGVVISSTNVWSGGNIPDIHKHLFPDTHKQLKIK